MEVEAKCPFWEFCGGSIIHDYWTKQTFPYGDPRQNYILIVCCTKDNEIRYLICGHYQLRIKLLEVRKNEAG